MHSRQSNGNFVLSRVKKKKVTILEQVKFHMRTKAADVRHLARASRSFLVTDSQLVISFVRKRVVEVWQIRCRAARPRQRKRIN